MGAGHTLTSFQEPVGETAESQSDGNSQSQRGEAGSSNEGSRFATSFTFAGKKRQPAVVAEAVPAAAAPTTGVADAEGTGFGAGGDERADDVPSSSTRAVASSWSQGVQYLDGVHVKKVHFTIISSYTLVLAARATLCPYQRDNGHQIWHNLYVLYLMILMFHSYKESTRINPSRWATSQAPERCHMYC